MATSDVDTYPDKRPPEGQSSGPPSQVGQSQRASNSSNGSSPPLASAASSVLGAIAAPQSNNQQNVTVETETVPSVTTLGVNPHSTLRIKRSQDSVPRLNFPKGTGKKRGLRLAQGSKADIFAAKVANAVEEQDSSGDETFVYQAPITAAHATDTLRRPYLRSSSNSSFHPSPQIAMYPQSDPYFSDDAAPTESEYDLIPSLPHRDSATGEAESGQTSPTKGLQPKDKRPNISTGIPQGGLQQKSREGSVQSSGHAPVLQGSRSFVVPKRTRTAAQLNNAQMPPHVQKSSLAPFNSAYDTDTSLGQEELREVQWPRNSRAASKSKHLTNEPISPMKDPNGSMRAKHSYLQRWKGSASHSDSYADESAPDEPIDERTSLLLGRSNLLNYQTSRNSYGKRRPNSLSTLGQQRQAPRAPRSSFSSQARDTNEFQGYTSDPELSPNNSIFNKLQTGASMSTRVMVGASLFLSMLLFVIFVGGVLLAAARPLRDFGVVALSDVLVSDKELVFTMVTRARNPGIFSRFIEQGELDIFATSSHTASSPYSLPHDAVKKAARTVLLGTVTELESPMLFRGGFSSPLQWRAASAKLVSPSANNTALWSEISAYEFDLTVKGVLSYNVLGGEHKETVSQTYHVPPPDFAFSIHT